MEKRGCSSTISIDGWDEKMSHDELWDDTLLIQQYDAAMDHVKHKVSKQQEESHFTKHESNHSKDTVMMQYSDGFSGDVSLPTQNNKKKKRKNRRKIEGEIGVDEGNSTSGARDSGTQAPPSGPRLQHRQFPHMDMKDDPLFDLPPPPPGLEFPAGLNSEALHTMLLSWYMTGYHTGYYRGVTASQPNTSRQSGPRNHHS